MDKTTRADCDSSLTVFEGNLGHSNQLGGLLVTASACPILALPSATISGLTIFKHQSSGVVFDGLEATQVLSAFLVDNAR